VLTADHGFMPAPEVSRARGLDAGRVSGSETLARINAELEKRFATPKLALYTSASALVLDKKLIAQKGLSFDTVASAARDLVLAEPGFAAAYTRTEITSRSRAGAPFFDAVTKAWNADLSGDIQVVLSRTGCSRRAREHDARVAVPVRHERADPVLRAGVDARGARRPARRGGRHRADAGPCSASPRRRPRRARRCRSAGVDVQNSDEGPVLALARGACPASAGRLDAGTRIARSAAVLRSKPPRVSFANSLELPAARSRRSPPASLPAAELEARASAAPVVEPPVTVPRQAPVSRCRLCTNSAKRFRLPLSSARTAPSAAPIFSARPGARYDIRNVTRDAAVADAVERPPRPSSAARWWLRHEIRRSGIWVVISESHSTRLAGDPGAPVEVGCRRPGAPHRRPA
jgi:hypothetical protein